VQKDGIKLFLKALSLSFIATFLAIAASVLIFVYVLINFVNDAGGYILSAALAFVVLMLPVFYANKYSLRRLLVEKIEQSIMVSQLCSIGLAYLLYVNFDYFHYGVTGIIAFLLVISFCMGVLTALLLVFFNRKNLFMPSKFYSRKVRIIVAVILTILLIAILFHKFAVKYKQDHPPFDLDNSGLCDPDRVAANACP
jgi:hypothetical protein